MPSAEPTSTSPGPVSTTAPPEEELIPTEPEGPLAPPCGDSRLAMTESCDDGNTIANDGCAADCSAVEPGYVCNGAGVPCEFAEVCGDSRIVGAEQCDDGNIVGADGCSASCQRERDFSCLTPGQACVSTVVCGDGRLGGAELCDDGLIDASFGEECDDGVNDGSYGGCASSCKLGPRCGDNAVQAEEACDDGNRTNGDGCNVNCKEEIMRDAAPLSQHPVGVPAAR